jgi:hypothetical protein
MVVVSSSSIKTDDIDISGVLSSRNGEDRRNLDHDNANLIYESVEFCTFEFKL